MRHTVPVHDLRATKLKVGSVNFTTEQLVDSLGTSKDDWLTFNLDRTLTEADEVSTNTCLSLAKVVDIWFSNTYQLSGKSPR
jgi:hypothetical protein